MDENQELRKLLWFRHGCSISTLYGDDGEMQCGHCMIDFKRDSIEDIKNKWEKLTLKEFKKLKFTMEGAIIKGESSMKIEELKQVEEIMKKVYNGVGFQGGFLTTFAKSYILADPDNQEILYLAAINLIKKYDLTGKQYTSKDGVIEFLAEVKTDMLNEQRLFLKD